MVGNDMLMIRELGSDRYNGFCLARRHGARRTLKAIRHHRCYREIFTAALRDVGKQRLMDIVSHTDRAWLAVKFLNNCAGRLTAKDKKILIANIVKYGNPFDVRVSILRNFLEPSLRRPLLERASGNHEDYSILLAYVADGYIQPPLTEEEKIFLEKKQW